MNLTFDRNLFINTSLDSGGLSMLCGVTHSLRQPGQYRGVLRRGGEDLATFYIDCDPNCAIAQANIDLAALDPAVVKTTRPMSSSAASGGPDCQCSGGATSAQPGKGFIVHPRGYLVFHVSAGAGGYSVLVRKADEDPHTPSFDSTRLSEDDVFSAAIIRPGVYSVENTLTTAKSRVRVAYPRRTKTGYRPPKPVTLECAANSIQPAQLEVQPGQGIHFHFKVPSRIKIDLVEPDDGPGESLAPKHLGQRRRAAQG